MCSGIETMLHYLLHHSLLRARLLGAKWLSSLNGGFQKNGQLELTNHPLQIKLMDLLRFLKPKWRSRLGDVKPIISQNRISWRMRFCSSEYGEHTPMKQLWLCWLSEVLSDRTNDWKNGIINLCAAHLMRHQLSIPDSAWSTHSKVRWGASSSMVTTICQP